MTRKHEPNLFDVKPKPERKAAAPAPNGAVQRAIGIWVGIFEKKFGEKPTIMPRDGAALKRLVLRYGAELVERRLPQFLALDDAYVAAEGYPLALLESSWNKLIVADRAAAGRVPDADATERYLRGLRGGR